MKRRNYSPAFKREPALLVVDQNYTVPDASRLWVLVFPQSNNVGQTTAL